MPDTLRENQMRKVLPLALLFFAVPAAANAIFPVTFLFLPGFGRAFWGVVALEAYLWARLLTFSAPRAVGLSLALNLLSYLGGIPLALASFDWLGSMTGLGMQSLAPAAPAPLLLRPLDFFLKSLWIEGGRGLGPIVWSLTVVTATALAISIAVEYGAVWAAAPYLKRARIELWRGAWKVNLASYAVLWPVIVIMTNYWIANPERAKMALPHWGLFSILKSLSF